MTRGLRGAIAAIVMVAGSYGAAGTAEPTAAAERQAGALAGDITVQLPSITVTRMVADDVHQRVFIGGESLMVVVGYDGGIIQRVSGRHAALTLSDDSSVLYAVGSYPPSLRVIDTATLEERQVSLEVCVQGLAFTGGRLWLLHTACGSTAQGLGYYDPATGEVRTGVIDVPGYYSTLRALPHQPDRLTVVSRLGSIDIYDVSSGTPTPVAHRSSSTNEDCQDAAWLRDGDLLSVSCGNVKDYRTFHTADLSPGPTLTTGQRGFTIAATPDGSHVALGGFGFSGSSYHIYVYDVASTPILDSYHRFPLGWLPPGGLAFSSTGRLFAVESRSDGTDYLHIFQDATRHITRVTVSVPEQTEYQGTVRGTGTLSYPPGVVTTATVSRTDRTGSYELGSIEVAADGTFSFTDTPGTTGPVTYRVSYPGDADHAAGTGEASTVVRPLPYDVNGDGHAEVIVGAPGEGLGSAEGAGMFHLLYGNATGPQAVGSVGIHQDSPGVPGVVESGDRFGAVNASGDFDLDGFADLAVAAPTEDVGSTTNGGAVSIFYGSAGGLRTGWTRSLDVSDTSLPTKTNARFGSALAVGDFNGDGRDDLAVGSPGAGPGYVTVHSGQSYGGLGYGTLWAQGSPGVPGVDASGDRFGQSLAAGDINGDRLADLAVGAPGDAEDRGWATGSVTVLHGGTQGLTATGSQRWSKDTVGVPGVPGSYSESRDDSPDGFGAQVELADFTGDRRADLAVGAPWAPVSVDGVRKRDAGTITVLYSDGSAIGTANAIQVTQQTPDMPGTVGQEDHLGATLAVGDPNGDGVADLAGYSPGDSYVTVVPGSSAGLRYALARAWTQNSAGIPDITEPYDWWGSSLRFADVTGTGRECLVVGAFGENDQRGAFTVMYSTADGLTGAGAQFFSQDTTGIPGTAESGDSLGFF